MDVIDADIDFGDLQAADAFHRADHVATDRGGQIRDGHAVLDHEVEIGGGLPLADFDCHSLRFARPSARHSLTDGPVSPGTYRLTFDIGAFHRSQGLAVAFFPEVKITFNVRDPDEHFHVPLLLSPFGYSTYRGT